MPSIEIEPTTTTPVAGDPYSTDNDVRNSLGNIRDRLPSWVTIAEFREQANAQLLDRLARTYPDGIPTFTGAGASAVRYAEAKLAAAEILEAIRVNLPDLGDAPARLRESAFASVDDGVIGYPAGSVDVPGTGGTGGTGGSTASAGPRVSSYTPLSAFPDPYEAGRFGERFE